MNKDREKFDKGMKALGRADFETAIDIFSDVVVENENHAEAWFNLGLCYLETGSVDFAIEALMRATSVNPAYGDAYYLLGTAMGASGNLDKAAEYYAKALEVEPTHQKAAELLHRTNAMLKSREHYRRAIKILHIKDRPEGWVNNAVRELLDSIVLFSNSPARHNLPQMAEEILKSGREEVIQVDIEGENKFWAKSCEAGHYCITKKNWNAAISAYREALQYRDWDAFVHHALGLAFFQAGDAEEGVKAWLRVLEIDPEYDFTVLRYVPDS